MKTFKIAALCLSMAAAAFTVQAKEIKYEADVAIVGGGPAGMVAAAYAAENGLKPILVEKLPGVGGNLMMLEITFGQRTKFTDQDQVYYPSDELIADFLAYSHYMVNPIMVRRFIERSGENIKWLTNRGVEIVGNTATELNGRRVGHIYKNVFPTAISSKPCGKLSWIMADKSLLKPGPTSSFKMPTAESSASMPRTI